MGARVGAPVMKLCSGNVSTKRKGNIRPIAKEALSERWSKDPDLDRSRCKDNTYYGFQTGEELCIYWEDEAGKRCDKRGRKIKSTGIIGFSGIMKPDMEYMKSLTAEQQEQFIKDGLRVMCGIYEEHGLKVDAVAIHRDEMVPHAHILGHDPDYVASKKITPKFFRALNRTFPEKMRELGYDVENMDAYDPEKAAGMSADELKAYKDELRVKRKKNNQSSLEYKKNKVAEQAAEVEKLKAELEDYKLTLSYRESYVNSMKHMLNARRIVSDLREKSLKHQVEEYTAKELELDTKQNTLNEWEDELIDSQYELWAKEGGITALLEQIEKEKEELWERTKAVAKREQLAIKKEQENKELIELGRKVKKQQRDAALADTNARVLPSQLQSGGDFDYGG